MPLSIRVPAVAEVAERWHAIAPLLEKATRRTEGRYEPVHLLQQAMAMPPQAGFWLIEDGPEDNKQLVAVAVGQFRTWPTGMRDLDIPFLGGSRLSEWWPLFVEATEKCARQAGCAAITSAVGRRGWSKFWAAHGVKVKVAGEMVVRELPRAA
jgi:hypothetical protein